MLPAVMAGRILAVGNLKGGTGKTTVAVNLGCSLASPRRELVLIDADSLKGGTGKTTVAVNLGCSLASPRREVVLIDADSQGTATAWGDFLKILKLVDAPASRLALLQKNAPSPDTAPPRRSASSTSRALTDEINRL